MLFRASILAASPRPDGTWSGRLGAYAPFLIIAGVVLFAVAIVVEEWRAGGMTSNEQAVRVELVFKRTEAGKLAVRSDLDGRELAVLPSADEGFIATSVRLLGRERRRYDVAETEPYRLTRWRDGRLTLTDPVIGTTIDLAAFGPTNARAFDIFLPAESKRP
jgi:putative photosynthetic complex assembly protein